MKLKLPEDARLPVWVVLVLVTLISATHVYDMFTNPTITTALATGFAFGLAVGLVAAMFITYWSDYED